MAIVLLSVTGLRSAEHSFDNGKEPLVVALTQDGHGADQDVEHSEPQNDDEGHGRPDRREKRGERPQQGM